MNLMNESILIITGYKHLYVSFYLGRSAEEAQFYSAVLFVLALFYYRKILIYLIGEEIEIFNAKLIFEKEILKVFCKEDKFIRD